MSFGNGAGGGAYPLRDLRGQGGSNRDSHQLRNEQLAQAEYSNQMDNEQEDGARGRGKT
jgi:hypothetical protein